MRIKRSERIFRVSPNAHLTSTQFILLINKTLVPSGNNGDDAYDGGERAESKAVSKRNITESRHRAAAAAAAVSILFAFAETRKGCSVPSIRCVENSLSARRCYCRRQKRRER